MACWIRCSAALERGGTGIGHPVAVNGYRVPMAAIAVEPGDFFPSGSDVVYVAGQGDAADNNYTIKIRGNGERELNFGFLDVYGTMPVGVQFVEALAIFDGYITCLRCAPTSLALGRGASSTS